MQRHNSKGDKRKSSLVGRTKNFNSKNFDYPIKFLNGFLVKFDIIYNREIKTIGISGGENDSTFE